MFGVLFGITLAFSVVLYRVEGDVVRLVSLLGTVNPADYFGAQPRRIGAIGTGCGHPATGLPVRQGAPGPRRSRAGRAWKAAAGPGGGGGLPARAGVAQQYSPSFEGVTRKHPAAFNR